MKPRPCPDGRCGAEDCPRCRPANFWPHPRTTTIWCERCESPIKPTEDAWESPPFSVLCDSCLRAMEDAQDAKLQANLDQAKELDEAKAKEEP